MPDIFSSLEENADGIFRTGLLFEILTGVAIGVRIVLRLLNHIKFGIEDWFLLAAAICFWLLEEFSFKAIVASRQGLGPSNPQFWKSLKYIYLSGLFYFPTIFFVNNSILCLYRRLFSSSTIRRICLAMIVFNILWFIPALLVEIFTCSPISRLWDLSIPGTCVWYSTFWLVLGLVELIADIILFVLPLREIVKLQLSRRNKLMLSLLFGLGAISIISGILRLALCYQGRKISYVDVGGDAIWRNVHLGVAVICACLATFRPIFIKGARF